MSKKDEALKQALEAAYLAGFKASGEGYNGEYPFDSSNPENDAVWLKDRDNALQEALAEQPAQIAGFDVVLDDSMPPNTIKFVQPAPATELREQEPVPIDWGAVHEKLCEVWQREISADEGLDEIQDLVVAATPPAQRKPLTDEQREEIAKGWRGRNWTVGDIIDATEAAHGIKENT